MYEQNGSLTQPKRGFTVAPSPFNAVKFDLGVIIVIGVLLLLLQDHITERLELQLLLLLGYGVCGMLWVVYRTRRIMLQFAKQAQDGQDSQ